jgi:hypothetical protein
VTDQPNRTELFDMLGVEPGALELLGVQVGAWGTEVTLDCSLDDERKFHVLFEGVTSIQWDVHDAPDEHETSTPVIAVFLGDANYGAAAIIATDIFELSVLYDDISLVKRW